MEKFIPKEKLSKKVRQELNRQNRGSWNGVNPITRKTENKKLYNRKKVRQGKENFPIAEPFCCKISFLI